VFSFLTCPYNIHCVNYGTIFMSCVNMWFEYPELPWLFLIASLDLVLNIHPVYPIYFNTECRYFISEMLLLLYLFVYRCDLVMLYIVFYVRKLLLCLCLQRVCNFPDFLSALCKGNPFLLLRVIVCVLLLWRSECFDVYIVVLVISFNIFCFFCYSACVYSM
jgi:hypothetical protein